MCLKRIDFSDYKIFKHHNSLELNRVTVITSNDNNVGKTSIIKLPLLVNNIISSMNSGEGLILKSHERRSYDNSSGSSILFHADKFIDLIHCGHVTNSLDFKLTHEDTELQFQMLDGMGLILNQTHNFTYNLPSFILKDTMMYSSKGVMKDVNDIDYSKFISKTDYISCNRVKPLSYYERVLSNDKNLDRVNIDAYNILIKESQSGMCTPLLDSVNEWYKSNFNCTIEIVQMQNIWHVMLRDNHGILTNFTNVGDSIINTLPLIVRAFRTVEPTNKEEVLVIVEQPEIGLNTKYHKELAKVMALNSTRNKKYLIETNSKKFISGLINLIKKGKFNKEDLTIYNINSNDGFFSSYSTLEKLDINDLL